eukprot:2054716-Rhodomonas_salina.4
MVSSTTGKTRGEKEKRKAMERPVNMMKTKTTREGARGRAHGAAGEDDVVDEYDASPSRVALQHHHLRVGETQRIWTGRNVM